MERAQPQRQIAEFSWTLADDVLRDVSVRG
jgi:hypothetical protein